jgi:NitT/TauT family transport system substrate-binding protein
MFTRRQMVSGAAAVAATPVMRAAAQQKSEVVISRQPGILYMPTHIIEQNKLIEKYAEKLGVPGVTTKWLNFNSGGAQQDALLSGNVDLINTGTGPLLLMWDRTKGGVKGLNASSAGPLVFVSRDPKIQTLRDLTEADKIAVPTVRISTQSILLQLAASKMFGPDQWGRFDPFTVQLGHPDAYIALRNAVHEVKNHFAAPPFHFYALKNVPGAHVVTSSTEIIGGPLSQAQFIVSTKFADANPKIIEAVRLASEEAKALIEKETKTAVAIYKEITGDKTEVADILELLTQPGMMDYNLYPQGTMVFATHLHRIGALKTLPASWKDYYLPIAHDLPGS